MCMQWYSIVPAISRATTQDFTPKCNKAIYLLKTNMSYVHIRCSKLQTAIIKIWWHYQCYDPSPLPDAPGRCPWYGAGRERRPSKRAVIRRRHCARRYNYTGTAPARLTRSDIVVGLARVPAIKLCARSGIVLSRCDRCGRQSRPK